MSARAVELVKTLTQQCQVAKNYERCLKKLKLIPSEDGRMLAHLSVSEEHVNVNGTLHGGYIATLVDYVSTCALFNSDIAKRGTSVDINVNYMKAARPGDNIEIDAWIVKSGRTLAFLAAELRFIDTKKIIATGTHTKYIGN